MLDPVQPLEYETGLLDIANQGVGGKTSTYRHHNIWPNVYSHFQASRGIETFSNSKKGCKKLRLLYPSKCYNFPSILNSKLRRGGSVSNEHLIQSLFFSVLT